MKQVGVYELKTHASRLLAEVERGESVTITRHGREIARIVPIEKNRRNIEELLEDFREIRKHTNLEGTSIRELIEAGRRY